MGTYSKRLGEDLLMSTHNIYFYTEIRKIICRYPLLSRAMCELSLKEMCLRAYTAVKDPDYIALDKDA